MKKTLLLAVAVFLLAGQVFAWDYSFDVFADGTTPFDRNNNWSPIDYPYNVGQLPSPGTLGEGGEKFDLEGLQVREDDRFVYVALANSFGYQAYSTAWNQTYNIGDLFIGVDGGQYGFAVDIIDGADNMGGTTGLYAVNSFDGIGDFPGTYYDYTSIRDQVGAYTLADGDYLGDVSFFKGFDQDYELDPMFNYESQTYVWEFCFDKSLLGDFKNLDFHVTLGCGNDLIEESYDAVPEPATLFLFGLGLVGAGVIRRRMRG